MRPFRSAIRCFAAAALCAFGLVSANAQSTNSGDIRGTVTDSSGALIPNVQVSVLNVNTGIEKLLTTNRDGLYDTSSIVAGTYKLTFTKQGFETYVRGPITVEVGYTTVNAPLKIGAATETITVNTDVPLLHTEGGDQTSTLEAKDMEQLPNIGGSNGPDWQNFMILLPGTSGTSGGSQGSSNPGQEVSSNGNLPYTNVLQDGASTTLPSSQNANPATFEDVQELQVSLSSFSAQYGVGGLVINQITKGGTDKFHGVLYEYFQNSSLDSLPASYNSMGVVNKLNYDDFGGTVSGPVKIPVMNLDKKAFFFFGYDQIHDNGLSSGTNTIPTAAVMSGQFTAPNSYTIYDPTTQTIAYDAHGNPYPVRKTFQSEYGSNAIPTSLIDSVSNNFQQYYPTTTNHIPYGHFTNQGESANFEGVYSNNFFAQYPSPTPWKRYFGRLDYDITSKNRFTMSDTQGNEIENSDNAVTACPIGCQGGDVDNNNAQVTDVWNISPKLINEARFGYTDQLNFFQDLSTGTGVPSKLGWKFAEGNILPAVQFQRNYPYAWIEPATNAQYKEFVFDPSDVVTMIRGKHVLHFGGEFAFYRDDTTTWGNVNGGTLVFNGSYTENWTLNGSGVASPNGNSGEEYADFLLGYSSYWSAGVTPEIGARLKKPQMFVQDDWKVRPNLTVNLGLRYEISHGFNEVKGNEASFDPTVVNPANNSLGAYWFGETKANGRNAMQANVFSTVMPRVGFSWLVRPSTTFRGGFGIYSYNFSLDTYGAVGSGLAGSVSYSGSLSDNSNGIYPVTKFNGNGTSYPLGGGTSAPLPFTSPSQSPTRFNGQGATYVPFHTPIPKIYQWNLGVEQQIGTNIAATLSYVASHGFNLAFPTDINAVPVNDLSPSDQTGCGSGASTCLQDYPLYQGIGGSVYNAISNYDSLQATITKRLSRGLSLSANYVWSHLLDDQDSSGWGSRAGPQEYQYATTLTQNLTYKNYGPSNFDVRNAFKSYVVYDLPFGKGRQFLNNNWLVDELVGGFQISGTLVLSAGNPFPIYTTGNNLYQGTGSQYANRVPGVTLIPQGGRSIYNWVNPAAFSNPGNGVFGDAQRNPVVGPGWQSENMSALKAFSLPWERMKLSLRVDAQNVFNHTSIGNPGSITLTGGNGPGNPYTASTAGAGNREITGSTISGRNIQIGARLAF
jgi:hypothetical protein